MSTTHNRIKIADLEINQPNKTLVTNTNGELEFNDLASTLDFKTLNGESIFGDGDISVQIIISTSQSINSLTHDSTGKSQQGKNVIINNGANNINYTINTPITASFLKHGSGTITFVQGVGRTMIEVDKTAILNGAVGSTATISSVGTIDYLRISNA